MPKIVDHDNQREIIAKAAWRVIRNDGFENATVRKIAQEAGLAPSSLRYYFNNQEQLLQFALRMVIERVENRFLKMNLLVNNITLEEAKQILLQLIPIDEEQKLEMEVWLSFSVKALRNPLLKGLNRDTYELMFQVVLKTLGYLNTAGLLKESLDLKFEAHRLHTLIDGLAVHRVISPDKMSPELMDYILMQHFKELEK